MISRTPRLPVVLCLATSVWAMSACARLAMAQGKSNSRPVQASDDDFDDVATLANFDDDPFVAREDLIRKKQLGFDPANIERFVLGTQGLQSIEEARTKLGFMAQIKIETINLACGLTADQRRKLRLASEGDIKRLVDHIEQVIANWRLAKVAQPPAVPREANDLRNAIDIGPFGRESFIHKTLARILTGAQSARCAEFGGIDRLEETIRIRAWPEAPDKIKDVRLTSAPIGDESLERLASLTSMHRLFIDSTQITDRGLAHIARLTNLEELDLERTAINGSGLVNLWHMKSLKVLKLGFTPVTDAGLANLPGLPSLETLKLEKTRVTNQGLDNLRLLPQLKVLSLYETQVTDAGLASLSTLNELRDLDLEATQITDAGLVHLGELTNLQELDLRRTGISDAGLEHLKKLLKLRKLWLGNTAVTDAGVARLRKALPRLIIRL